MEEFIRIQDKNLFLLKTALLELKEAQLWIGRADGPTDDDDEKVLARREEDKKENSIFGIEAMDLKESERYPGWFEVDTSSWSEGAYRLNVHSHAGVQSPVGTKIQSLRDLEYSWPIFKEEYMYDLADGQGAFLYLERNGRGFCIRIKKDADGKISAAGDGLEWFENK